MSMDITKGATRVHIDPKRWSEFRAVVLTSYEYLNGAVQRAVVEFASAGGAVVVGPHLPDRNERLQPDTTLRDALGDPRSTGFGDVYRIGSGQVVLLPSLPSAAAFAG